MAFTEQEAKDLRMPLALLTQWEHLMQMLWKWAIEVELPGLKNGENEILCTYGVIGGYFINRQYIEFEFKPHNETEGAYFKMRYIGNIKTALYALSSYIDDLNK